MQHGITEGCRLLAIDGARLDTLPAVDALEVRSQVCVCGQAPMGEHCFAIFVARLVGMCTD